jgi:hypothetical protein
LEEATRFLLWLFVIVISESAEDMDGAPDSASGRGCVGSGKLGDIFIGAD